MSAPTATVDLRTTVIGSFPKPSYLKIPDFFAKGEKVRASGVASAAIAKVACAATPRSS